VRVTGVDVSLAARDDGGRPRIEILATVRAFDRTGVEMEALTAVAASGLALIDMIKAIDPAAVLTDIRVEEKLGGKTGAWQRPDVAAGADSPAGGPGSRAAGPPGGSGGSGAAGGAA